MSHDLWYYIPHCSESSLGWRWRDDDESSVVVSWWLLHCRPLWRSSVLQRHDLTNFVVIEINITLCSSTIGTKHTIFICFIYKIVNNIIVLNLFLSIQYFIFLRHNNFSWHLCFPSLVSQMTYIVVTLLCWFTFT